VLSNSYLNRATVFGGTGYLGQYIVRQLTHDGYRVRVAVRHPRSELFQELNGTVEQVQADIADSLSVSRALAGANSVVNTVGLYVETNTASFSAVHISGAREVAVQAASRGAKVVHISGIGADLKSESRYVAARAAGEQTIREEAPDAVILRPSALFGPVKCCEADRITPYIPQGRQGHNEQLQQRFAADPPEPEQANAVDAMVHRLQTRKGKAVYAQRKSTVETVFGIIKHVQGFRQFLLRGLDTVGGEWSLVCIGWNLKRLHALKG